MTDAKKGGLLFKDGDWELRSRPPLDQFDLPLVNSRLWHNCDGYSWYVWEADPQCCHCKKPPPTAILGLKALHNWDR